MSILSRYNATGDAIHAAMLYVGITKSRYVMKIRIFAICVLCAVVALVGLTSWFKTDNRSRREDAAERSASKTNARIAEAKIQLHTPTTHGTTPHSKTKPILDFGADDDETDDDWTPAEKLLAERIEKALDDENVDEAIACAGAALKCEKVEIRDSMVNALGWFGGKALPELVPFLADPDEDVHENAKSQISMALSDIGNDTERIGIVEKIIGVINDEDELEDFANEYIGIDEKLAVESLIRVITSKGSSEGVAKAKETYEFVTGDEWSGEKDALRWIAEEYESPDAGDLGTQSPAASSDSVGM